LAPLDAPLARKSEESLAIVAVWAQLETMIAGTREPSSNVV